MNFHRPPALLLAAVLGLGVFAATSALAHHRGDYSVRVVCETAGCPEVTHRGQAWVLASWGERYELELTNHSSRWVEAVIAVDGRDAINGRKASKTYRGYIIAPFDSVRVDGWRTGSHEVAAFRFTSVPDSYAGRHGDRTRGIGRIEVAFFPGRLDEPSRPLYQPRGHSHGATGGLEDSSAGRAEAEATPKPKASAKRGDHGGAIVSRRRPPREHQHLGTQYGENRYSESVQVDFRRDRRNTPRRRVVLRYDNRAGFAERGIPQPGEWHRPYPQPIPRPNPRVPYANGRDYAAPPPH